MKEDKIKTLQNQIKNWLKIEENQKCVDTLQTILCMIEENAESK